ncbi:MAG: PLP-dependent decarboxylase [Gammaproteobacteria bacterium]|nr:PLP-dependent decarboxylase [Gammaproteobacteria bacterium]
MKTLTPQFKQQLSEFAPSQNSPFFVYDLDALQQHIASLQNDQIKLWFAVKANPLSRVIQTLDQEGMNFDVASLGELEQVLAQGVSPERILNTGPAKSKSQIKHFLERGVNTYVVESINQLALLNQLASEVDFTPQVLLRVQLRFDGDASNPLGGNNLTPFGLGIAEWSQLTLNHYRAIDVVGLHIFQWGNMLDPQQLISLWQQMVPPLVSLAQQLDFELKVLDLGGGLGIPYARGENSLDWSMLVTALTEIKQQANVNELWLELGRFAVGEYGHYLTPVVDRKTSYQQQMLVLEGGINHLLRPAITDQPFPVQLLRTSAEPAQSFHIHGPLCTSLDKLGVLDLPQDVTVDDVLIFSQCGAYGFTEAMPFFLCHALPSEVVYQAGKFEVVRPAQPASSYLF